MKVLKNEPLNKYTTFGLGGNCKNLYVPENRGELVQIVLEKRDVKFIGGGSNLLINDSHDFDNIVLLREFSNEIMIDNDMVVASAGVRLQKLINFINDNDMGGIEYLFSVPGLVGGAIYMNAGRGKAYNCTIADHIVSVEALCLTDTKYGERGSIIELTKEECEFKYRSSIFHNNEYLILSAKFKFPEMSKDESAKRKQERLDLCKVKQDNSGGNFGTVFCEANGKLMKLVRKLQLGSKDGIHFSGKALNWMINTKGKNADAGSFDDTIKLMDKVRKLHKLFRKPCRSEVIIWK